MGKVVNLADYRKTTVATENETGIDPSYATDRKAKQLADRKEANESIVKGLRKV